MSNYHAWRRFAATCLLALGVSLGGPSALAAPTTPTSDFTDNGDGTVTHKTTGLIWKRCAEGQSWTGSDCAGTASSHTWDQAKALTSSFAGKNDWRLPTVAELVTIVERENFNPAINATIFPGTPTNNYFWSASAYAGGSSNAWYVFFYHGNDYSYGKSNTGHVRLVRGGQSLDSYGFYTPTSDFTDNGDGSITHKKTSLTWKRCAEGQTWNGSGCSGAVSTYSWAQATALTSTYAGNSDWRLPTQNELLAIVEWSKTSPAINGTIFPGTPSEWFWSASAYTGNTGYGWAVNFNVGDGYFGKSDTYPVRLVRGGQSGASSTTAGLTGLSVSCPSTVAASASGSCTATATYSDGTSKAPSATWISSNSTALSVSSSGSLTAGLPTTDTAVTIIASYTEGSVSKTATATVTVKAAAAKLSGLTISGDASVKSGNSITLTATGSYSDGTSHSISPTWSVSDSSVATISNGVLTAKTVTTDTPLAVTASHTENGVTQTATWMVSVKAAAATVTSLLISGASSVNAGASASYTASAVYNDGTTKTASNVTWAVSGSGATVDAAGNLTASNVTADTSVTLTAIYTDNGASKTATLTVAIKAATTAASACSGTASNLSAMTVAGKAIKSPGDSLDVSYCLKNFNSATKFDVYVAVMLPDGSFLFMQSAGFFGTPSFVPYDGKKAPVAYLSNTLIPDKSGSVLNISVLPMELPTGTYTFYAIPVFAGKDVMNGFNWVGTLASAKLNFIR